jgi:hypothetical protein
MASAPGGIIHFLRAADRWREDAALILRAVAIDRCSNRGPPNMIRSLRHPLRLSLATLLLAGMFVHCPALRAAVLTDPDALRLTITDPRLTVNGLAWWNEEKPALRRLPTRLKDSFRPQVWSLAQSPSGGRVRFRTDSTSIGLVAQGSAPSAGNMSAIGQAGFDLYVNGRYQGSGWPDKEGRTAKEWSLGGARESREITFYLPLYQSVRVNEIVLDPGAKVEAPGPFAVAKPVVFYGSSITQGAAASNPGTAYQAMLGRWLDTDYVNLGFSGNGIGEPEVARAVAETDASCFVLDYWANPKPEVFRETLPGFVDILRAKHPHTPIVLTGPYFNPSENVPGPAGDWQIEKRKIAPAFVAERRAAGDTNIHYVDGFEMLSPDQADGLADGRHANTMGFFFCARGLEPHLRKVLGLPAGPKR